MHTNVLIPTDFQMDSLNTIKKVVQDLNEDDTVTITLLHGYYLSDSITKLLFQSKKDILSQIVQPEFFEGCELLKSKYASNLTQVKIDLFHRLTSRVFQSYINKNEIDCVYIPSGLKANRTSKRSFDILPYVKKCCENVQFVEFESKHEGKFGKFL